MAELRPFPPSPRRRALARQAGLHAASPILVGGVACAAALVAISMLGAAAAARIGAWIAAAARLEASLAPHDVTRAVLELAAPVIVVIALVAVIAHFAQTRSLWLPRRSIAGAPVVERPRGVLDLAAAAIVGVVAFGWLWLVAPRIAALSSVPLAGGLMIASAAATFAIAWIVIGVFDALLRHRELALAMHMTPREKREDERLAGIDPRWRRPREEPSSVAGATLLVLGDDIAIAVAWDPIRRPIPTRTATGRGAKSTQLLALARRHAIPVHRDAELARRLFDTGPVPEGHWPRLAEIIAAVRR